MVVRGCYGLFLVANLCIYVLMYVLGWFEVVRGRLISPKTWDRNVEIFLDNLDNL